MLQHIKVLESSGLIRIERRGRVRTCGVDVTGFRVGSTTVTALGSGVSTDSRSASESRWDDAENGTFTVARTLAAPVERVRWALVDEEDIGYLADASVAS